MLYCCNRRAIASCPRFFAQASGVAHAGSSGRLRGAARSSSSVTISRCPNFAAHASGGPKVLVARGQIGARVEQRLRLRGRRCGPLRGAA